MRHIRNLKADQHHNIYLQRSWNKYGESAFSMEVVISSKRDLQNKEQKILDKVASSKKTYNISSSATGGDYITNHPNAADIRKQISKSVNDNLNKLSDDKKKDLFGHPGKSNPNWKGGIYSEKTTCPDCGEYKTYSANKCQSCRSISGKDNPFYGKHHSDETKAEISHANSGSYKGDQENQLW